MDQPVYQVIKTAVPTEMKNSASNITSAVAKDGVDSAKKSGLKKISARQNVIILNQRKKKLEPGNVGVAKGNVPKTAKKVAVEKIPSTGKSCCNEKLKTIAKLTTENNNLRKKLESLSKRYDKLHSDYSDLRENFEEKVKECEKQHEICAPPILSVSNYIELL